MKKLIIDVFYDEEKNIATVCGGIFNEFTDNSCRLIKAALSPIPAPYIPGEFYKRELPCIQKLILEEIGLEKLKEEFDCIIVDGLYSFGPDKPGLGGYLDSWLRNQGVEIEVIGIAKNKFHSAQAEEVLRGKSKKPLWVNGNRRKNYSDLIKKMSGEFRIPFLVKAVDQGSRGI